MMPERKCLECGETLHGRADQKFCSDQCRNVFNNKQSAATNNTIRRVNRILKKNQSLLAQMNNSGKMTINKDELVKNEFHFGYFTNQLTRQGRTYNFCYDQGYSLADGEKVILVRKKF
jgi:predicted nucleic acid-binding Zn ribbon protein